jgi:hypothetical protein
MTNSVNLDRALLTYIQQLDHLRENLRQPALREEFERAARLLPQLPKVAHEPPA